MSRQVILTDEAPAASGPYSQAIRVGDLIFTPGQLGIDPRTDELTGTDIESQTHQVLKNIQAIVQAGGSCLQHVVEATVFLTDMEEWSRMHAVYAQYLGEDRPVRSVRQATALPRAARVMIEVVAEACHCLDQ